MKISSLKPSNGQELFENFTIQSNGFKKNIAVAQISFERNTIFNLLKIYQFIFKNHYKIEPFWLCVNLDAWLKEELSYKRRELRAKFQQQVDALDRELKIDEGKARLAQVLSSVTLSENPGVFDYLFKTDFEKLLDIKKDISNFQEAEREIGLWKASFTIISSAQFLQEYEKFSPAILKTLKRRASYLVFLRDPIHSLDLNSRQLIEYFE